MGIRTNWLVSGERVSVLLSTPHLSRIEGVVMKAAMFGLYMRAKMTETLGSEESANSDIMVPWSSVIVIERIPGEQ